MRAFAKMELGKHRSVVAWAQWCCINNKETCSMKKAKRLQVSRETIRKLDATEIRYAVGGRINLSQFGVCLPSEQNTACAACVSDVNCL
jgi:hypothetical protein